MYDIEVTMNFIQLLIAFTVLLVAIVGSYIKSRSANKAEMATMQAQIKHQDGKIVDIDRKMDKMKEDNHDGQKDLWRKLDELGSTMHRIELALVNKVDRK